MHKEKRLGLLLAAGFSLLAGFLSAGFLHGFLTNHIGQISMGYLLHLLLTDRRFLALFAMVGGLLFLAIIVFLLDDKPYKGQLKPVGTASSILIPQAAGEYQHGSARFMSEAEIESTFAKATLYEDDVQRILQSNGTVKAEKTTESIIDEKKEGIADCCVSKY